MLFDKAYYSSFCDNGADSTTMLRESLAANDAKTRSFLEKLITACARWRYTTGYRYEHDDATAIKLLSLSSTHFLVHPYQNQNGEFIAVT